MIRTISNGTISLAVAEEGGEMMSIIFNGAEYLWQGNSAYWKDRAINLFPINGRLKDGEYTYRGKTYKMNIHGFVRRAKLQCVKETETSLAFRMLSDERTRETYPFDFSYEVEYLLKGCRIEVMYTVMNNGAEPMYFCLGGHPGFNVPIDNIGNFASYRLEFPKHAEPRKVIFDDALLITGKTEPFPLDNGTLALSHRLFDVDAIFLENAGTFVTLKSDLTCRKIKLDFKDMPYLGLWHTPRTDAPFLCIEPWSALPSYGDRPEELTTKRDATKLAPDGVYRNRWSITLF
jgi:galactose mutarotase-like enzyme